MLLIHNLSVAIDETPILRDISLNLPPGSIHAIMGPNGSGKSTLAQVIMGLPTYTVLKGTSTFNGDDITAISSEERAKRGIFLAFQQPPAIPGVYVQVFLKEIYHAVTGIAMNMDAFNTLLDPLLSLLRIDRSFLHRALNDGFSGGEKKRFEMLQLLLLKPKLAILDEIDSGLDIDALKLVAYALQYARQEQPDMSVLLITHYQRILEYINPDVVHVLCKGRVVTSGDHTLLSIIERKGYNAFDQTT